MNVNSKRTREESQSPAPAKKQRPCSSELAKMPEDILGHICSFLLFEELTALSSVSKQWVVITARTPFWKDLSSKAKLILQPGELARDAFMHALHKNNAKAQLTAARFFFESKNIFSNISIKKTLIKLDEALLAQKIPAIKPLDVDMCITLLKAAQSHFDYASSRLMDMEVEQKLQQVIKSNISPTMSAAANILFVELKIKHRTEELTDDQAFAVAQGVSQNSAAASWIRSQAALAMAIMRVEDRTNAITDDQAFAICQAVSQNPAAADSTRALADLKMATLGCQKRTNAITVDQAFALLQGVVQNPAAKDCIRAAAHFFIACMRLFNQTSIIITERARPSLTRDYKGPGPR